MSKRTINSFVNSYDFDKYLKFLDFDHKVLYRESEITSIDMLFRGKNYLAIIALHDHRQVAHFVVLRKDSAGDVAADGTTVHARYTYMDCLGDPIPQFLQNLFDSGSPVEVEYETRRLMALDGIICGKYCLSFAMAGDLKLSKWVDILTSSKKFKPDDIIDNLYRLEYSQTQLTIEPNQSVFL